MYTGRKYELVPRLIDTFINYSPRSNSSIVKAIRDNGADGLKLKKFLSLMDIKQ